ncbi:MAG: LpxL/LpxP family Kdo(2)-lipid IV(A) lauroyl/palmitoleoyl acyltransferase [Gammaproteobacteria bacterium]|nr:LpxL/LpxP family Kdo(2)-lipid IV(A) lauroyl/palmitoleoyl acyltransferase [Gammaproteobacteria bacterium]
MLARLAAFPPVLSAVADTDSDKLQTFAPDSAHYWPTRLGLGLLRLTARLPYRWQYGLGVALGELMFRCARGRRAIADTNLRMCFPELSAGQRRELLRENMHATGIGLVEVGTSWWTPDARLRPITEIRGREHLDAALAGGKGAILLSYHFTSLELCGHLLARAVDLVAMYRPHPNPVFDAQMLAGRERSAKRAIPRDDVRGAVKALKGNLPLWYAADQDYGRKHSIFVPFFGIPAATITATSRFARLSGAPVVPFTHRRLSGGRGFVLELHAPLTGMGRGDDVADARAVNAVLEDWLRRYPADYLWLHRRFKTRPEGEAGVYGEDRKHRDRLSAKRLDKWLAGAERLLAREDFQLYRQADGGWLALHPRPRGWRALFARPAAAHERAQARLEALGLPVLPADDFRFCPSRNCDVRLLPAEAGAAPLQGVAESPEALRRLDEFLHLLDRSGVFLPPEAWLLDGMGAYRIAHPAACRFEQTGVLARLLAALPDALRLALNARVSP